MARRAHRVHAVRTLAETSTLAECVEKRWLWGQTWCGEQNGSRLPSDLAGEDPFAYARRNANCPKCAAAIGKARLAQLGDRVKVEAVEVPKTSWGKQYRSLNRLIVDGEHVGWIVMQNGWGNPWELHELTSDPERMYGGLISSSPSRFTDPAKAVIFQRVHSASRDMMASAGLRAREGGFLPTLAEMAVNREARKVREAAAETERAEERRVRLIELERKAGLRKEREQLALDGIKTALLRPDLTNLETAGLNAALEIISGKDVQ